MNNENDVDAEENENENDTDVAERDNDDKHPDIANEEFALLNDEFKSPQSASVTSPRSSIFASLRHSLSKTSILSEEKEHFIPSANNENLILHINDPLWIKKRSVIQQLLLR